MQLPLLQPDVRLALPKQVHVRLFVPSPNPLGFFRTNIVAAEYFSRRPNGLEIQIDPAAFYLTTQGALQKAHFENPAVLDQLALWGKVLEQFGPQPLLDRNSFSQDELERIVGAEVRIPVQIAYQPHPKERRVLYQTGMDVSRIYVPVKSDKLVFEPGVSTVYLAEDPAVQEVLKELRVA